MTLQLAPPKTPLRVMDGDLYVGSTGIPFSCVIGLYRRGEAAETIQGEPYPSLSLGEVYAVIAYYLEHQPEMDAFLAKRREESDRLEDECRARSEPFVRRLLERARERGLLKDRP